MTIKHTPEPWCLPPGDLIFVSKVGGKGYVAKMMPLGAPRDRKGLPTDISDEMCANARRIVACVNACRGLLTDELEQKGLVAAVGTQLLEADQQRDELLEELVITLGSLKEICHLRQIPLPESAIRRAEAAIAKAKGGAA